MKKTTKRNRKKLTLARVTLRKLDDRKLGNVAGAGSGLTCMCGPTGANNTFCAC